MFRLIAALDQAALLASLDILWKGMLAISVVIGIIIFVTYAMNHIAYKAEDAKKAKEEQNASNSQN